MRILLMPKPVTLVALALGCIAFDAPSQLLPKIGHSILFVGNSLTYTNDLPGTVAALATSIGDTIRVSSVATSNFALIDHLNGGSDALARIRSGGWEYVVLQQGPSSLASSQDSLRIWTQMFNTSIRAVGAQPALLMVWPSIDRIAFFDDIRLSYQNAAKSVGGAFYPAGGAWVKAWAADSSLALYGPDGYHPSQLGTYLAALVVFECVTRTDARVLPATASVGGALLTADASTIRTLQRAAHQANVEFHGC
jgi:hypothetical protein